MSHTGVSFREAKKALNESSNVDQGPVAPDVQGHTATTSPSRPAHSYAAAAQTIRQTFTAKTLATVQIQTDNPLVAPVANGTDSESREGGINSSLPQHCSCAAGTDKMANIAKFLVLAVQSIVQTVQDKELAHKITSSIKQIAAELLGFTGADTLSVLST